MASREKKAPSGQRKQATAATLATGASLAIPQQQQKDTSPTDAVVKNESVSETPKAPRNRTVAAKRAAAKKATIKKAASIIKSKSRKLSQRITKKMLKNPEVKKSLLKNGIRNRKAAKPPVLEPIYPVNENMKRKRVKKEEDKKGIKEDDDDVDEAIHSIMSELDLPKKRNKSLKKIKVEETIEEVMDNLSDLIRAEDIKTETAEDARNKKMKLLTDLKKENLENKFEAQNKVIDMLDLNVAKKKNTVITTRRHSIEKFPLSCPKSISIFNNNPRSISPRSKRASKLCPGVEKRSSPYTTRSDSPARILRNGKHRKLKDLNLLEGLDMEHRRRKRLCSEYSGSEVSAISKSGYESDSSFSDLASLHGNAETIEHEIKKELIEAVKNPEEKVEDSEQNIDTNSNVCETIELDSNPSSKVPDKSKILGIMKQAFNDSRKSTEIPVSTFYGNGEIQNSETPLPKLEPIELNPKQIPEEPEPEPEPNQQQQQEESETPKEDEPPILEPMNIENQTINENSPIEKDSIEKDSVEKDSVEKDSVEKDSIENSPPKAIQLIPTASLLKEEIQIDPAPPIVEEVEIPMETKEQTDVEPEETPPAKIELEVIETPENLAIKETILKALGLQSLRAAEEAKQKGKDKEKDKDVPQKTDNYTGTLKTVIKLNRNDRKRGKKMSLQKNKKGASKEEVKEEGKVEEKASISTRERESTWKSHGNQSSDTAGALRKSHYPNRSNMADGSSEHTSDGDAAAGEDGKSLVIPEKASSFSIHPDRLCKDECSYCFGKFGLFDTPCHIAQMKSVERQDKILAAEKHLTRDSCLCDACYRHVDRKSNTPSYTANKSFKRNVLTAPAPKENHCHVLGCQKASTNILRRKWIIKMRKSICRVINLDLDNPGLHSIPICDEHYTALEHLMTCAICKRKLAKNHIHYLGQELNELNEKLNAMNIPVKLEEKPVVCKLCRYYASVSLSNEDDQSTQDFIKKYTKRLLHFHDVKQLDEEEADEPIILPVKDKMETSTRSRKKKSSKSPNRIIEPSPPATDSQTDEAEQMSDQNTAPSSESRAESPSDYSVDYQTLIPNIAMDCGSDLESKKETRKQQQQQPVLLKKIALREAVEISKNLKIPSVTSKSADIAVQRLGSNPSISVRQLFPGEEDLNLQGTIEFNNVKERTPEGWEKCTATIQYDLDMKNLWQELQKPYGNQSSFLRHLILLEKYFRNGDLVLSPNASHHSINYSESVQNRLRAYDNTPTQPLSMISPNPKPQKSNSGIITSKESAQNLGIINVANIPKNTPMTITQLNSSGLLVNSVKSSVPPGLTPLQPGTSKLVKVPQPQKIKFPITKNWRPNLIPIDTLKKVEKKPGLVQVISAGKAYHITVEDYKKMCAIKRTFDLKQKKLQEIQKMKSEQKPNSNSLLKSMNPKKVSAKQPEPDKEESLSSLEKLDKQVEKLEMKFNESKSPPPQSVVMILPKIPKSLTVIPQTVPRHQKS